MSWTPISNTVPQYEEDGIAASGFYIKFYEAGTTTPTAMATDSTGATTLDKCELNTEGYPKNGSNAVFIPHIDRRYKIALFRNATDADNNNLNNAVWPVDDLSPFKTDDSVIQTQIDTIALLRAFEPTKDGQQISLLGHTLPGIGGDPFYFDESDTNSADNNGTIIVTAGGKCWKRVLLGIVTPEMFGALGDGSTDEVLVIQKTFDYCGDNLINCLLNPSVHYRVTGPVFFRSSIEYFFEGKIVNDRPLADVVTFGDSFTAMTGAFDNTFYNALTYDSATSITAGTNTINIGAPAAASYSIGDTVIVRDTASINPGQPTPSEYMRFNEVTEINSGVLSLRYEHDESVTGASISLTDDQVDFYNLQSGDRQKCYVLKDAIIHGLNVESVHFWTAATATMNCKLVGGCQVKSTALWYGNSFQRTTIDSVNGLFSRQLFEIASNSYQMSIGTITASRFGTDETSINLGLFSENSKDCSIGEIFCNADSFNRFTPAIAFTNSNNCGISGGGMSLTGARGTIVSFSEAVAGNSTNNYVDGVSFSCGAAAYMFDMIINGTSAITNPALRNCNFTGDDALVGSLCRLSLDGFEFSGNTFTQPESAAFFTGVANGRITGNNIPGGFSASTGSLERHLASNYLNNNVTNENSNIKGWESLNSQRLSILSTTTGNPVTTLTAGFPSFSSSIPNKVSILISGKCFGTGGNKTVQLYAAGTKIAEVIQNSATQDAFKVVVDLAMTNVDINAIVSVVEEGVPEVLTRVNVTGLNFTTTAYDLELRSWVDVGGDSVSIDNFNSLYIENI